MSKKMMISYNEILCSAASHQLNENEVVFVGQGFPLYASMLAKKLGKKLYLVMEAGILDFDPYRAPVHISDMSAMKGCMHCCSMIDVFSYYLFNGHIDVGFLGGAQIDKYGNLNTSYKGDPTNPRNRIAGSGGANEIGGYARRTIIIIRHGKFVEEPYYITTPGYLEGGKSREEAGMPGGPDVVVSLKGIFKFDKNTKELYLDSVHPGYEVDDIQKDIPWELKVSPNLKRTPIPTMDELDIMREFIPNVSVGKTRWGIVQIQQMKDYMHIKHQQLKKLML
ncbi:MAG: glutaconate CoA-transferase [Candidatus Lokiarchaeota archaeon]|nr:glutaconate CoA-transferase [Candidatus Lokiarchaeota archaeon]